MLNLKRLARVPLLCVPSVWRSKPYVLALLLSLSTGVLPLQAAETPATPQWQDLESQHWAYPVLRKLAEKYSLYLGLPDGLFEGARALTRYEAAALALQILESLQQGPKLEVTESQALEQIESALRTELRALDERVEMLEDQSDLQALEHLQLSEQMRQFQANLPFKLFGSLALRSCSMGETVKGEILGNLLQVRLGAGIRGQVSPDWDYELRLLSTDNQSYNLSWFPFGGTHIPRSLIALDRFFMRWRPLVAQGWQPRLDLSVGKALNPLPETQLLFDEDVSFTGLQQTLSWHEPLPHWKELSLSLVEQAVLMEETFITASLWAGKLASEWEWGQWNWRSAVSYSHYLGTDRLRPYSFSQGYLGPFSQRNRLGPNDDFVSDFQLLNGFTQVSWNWHENWPVTIFGDYVQNLGAADQNQGWLMGARIGALKQVGDWELSYQYRLMQQDYNLSLMVDEFYAGTDVAGHMLELGAQVAHQTQALATLVTRESLSSPEHGMLWIAYLTLRQDF